MANPKRKKAATNNGPTNGADGNNDGVVAFDAEIRRTAYELYLARNAEDGDEVSDWVEAERLVRAREGQR